MGRNSVSLRIDGQMLRKILKDHDLNFSERAASYGITRQAFNNWLSENRIPARALVELALDLKLSKEQIDQFLIGSNEKEKRLNNRKWTITIEEHE